MPQDANGNWGRYLSLGLEMAGGVILGLVIGKWLDQRYGWGSRATLIGAMLGVAAGMYLLIKQAIRMNRDK